MHWPVEHRAALDALLAIDDALAEVVTSSTQPALGAIRLAWWRDALESLDGKAAPPEPRLQAAAETLSPRGITGSMLAELEDGWAALLDEEPDMGRAVERGARLFAFGARLLGGEDRLLGEAGRVFAAAQLLRQARSPRHDPTGELARLAGHRFPRQLRPLTGLARLAARDFRRLPEIEPEATPGRAAALLSHRLSGRIA